MTDKENLLVVLSIFTLKFNVFELLRRFNNFFNPLCVVTDVREYRMLSDVALIFLNEALGFDSLNVPSALVSERIIIRPRQAVRHLKVFTGPIGAEGSR